MNTSRVEKLKVSFDLSFHVIPCKLLSLDVFDETGVAQKDSIHNIYKHKLSADGYRMGAPVKHELGDTILTEKQLEDMQKEYGVDAPSEEIGPCGNCYGAGKEGECCQTCHDVKAAYLTKGWMFKPQEVAQCRKEAFFETMKDQFAEDGGCQVYGTLELSRASGHFHIAPHKTLHTTGLQAGLISLLDLISFTFEQFNITHTVNSLSFGDTYPGIRNPLDGQYRKVEDTHGMYQYYLKIVPTRYLHLDGREIESNQYSVTEHMRHLAPNSGRGLPGVYFNYELSPIQAVFEEKQKSFMSFITSVCAIIGGIYTVIGIFDGFILRVIDSFGKSLLQS